MEHYIKTYINESQSRMNGKTDRKNNNKYTEKQIIENALYHITSNGVHSNVKLSESFPAFCEFVTTHYPQINLLEVLDHSSNSMSFDYYLDDEPDTMITYMICNMNHTWDSGYTHDYGDRYDHLKILSKEKCNDIYHAIYFLVVKMGCYCNPEYSNYIREILRLQYRYDYKPYFEGEENQSIPKYIYEYFYALLYLFKHGKNIEKIQKEYLLRYIRRKKTIAISL
jgi:hypothetical protein